MELNSEDVEAKIGELIYAISYHRPDATRNFFYNLPLVISKHNSERELIDLITFIHGWCDLGDPLCIKTLAQYLPLLFPENASIDLILAFLPLIEEFIMKDGTYSINDLLPFVPHFACNMDNKMLNSFVIESLIAFVDQQESDIKAAGIYFFSELIEFMTQANTLKIIQLLLTYTATKFSILKLALIDTYPKFSKHSDKPDELFNILVSNYLTDKNFIVKSHAIRMSANYISYFQSVQPLLDIAQSTSWQIQLAFLDSVDHFIKLSPDIESKLLQMGKSSEVCIRVEATKQIANVFEELSDKETVFKIVESDLRHKNKEIILCAFQLVSKILTKYPEQIPRFHEYIQVLKTTKSSPVMLATLQHLVPYCQVNEKDAETIKKWIGILLKKIKWRYVCAILDILAAYLENESLSELSVGYIDEYITKLTHPILTVRLHCCMDLVTFSLKLGWDFVKEKILPHTCSVNDQNKKQIQRSLARFYYGLRAIHPPEDVSLLIEQEIAKMDGSAFETR